MNLERPVSDLMTAAPVTVGCDDSLTDVWTLMLNEGFHHAPVVDGDRLVGMLSATDVMRALGETDPSLLDTGVVLNEQHIVRSLMSTDITGVLQDTPLREAVQILARGRFHSLPVMRGATLVGIITTTDLLEAVLAEA